ACRVVSKAAPMTVQESPALWACVLFPVRLALACSRLARAARMLRKWVASYARQLRIGSDFMSGLDEQLRDTTSRKCMHVGATWQWCKLEESVLVQRYLKTFSPIIYRVYTAKWPH